MAEKYPVEVSTFKVVGRLAKGVADSNDTGQEPDLVPISGAVVTFTPSINPPIYKVPTATVPITIFQESIVATTGADGYLRTADDASPGVYLPWGMDPNITPTGWTWNVSISVGGNFPARTFSITGSKNGIVDLATVIPVPANPGQDVVAWSAVVNQVTAARDATLAVGTTNDAIMTSVANTPGSAFSNFIVGSFDSKIEQNRYPDPVNIPILSSFRDKLLMCRRAPASITVPGDSITWGVGVDGLPASSTGALGPQQDKYRENAWPMQLGEKLNLLYGTGSSIGFLGPGYSDRTSTWAAAISATGSLFNAGLGPFGNQSGTNKGGATMQYGGIIKWDKNTLTRPFTELDVFVHADTVNPAFPSVYVDGVKVYTGAAATGQFAKVTVTGLSDTLHDIELRHELASTTVYGAFIVPRRSNGVVVNRIASSGATSTDAVANARGTKVAVMQGFTDLVIDALSVNDQIQQVPLATFKSNKKQIIDAATSPVLLIDGPPLLAPAGTLKPNDYRNVMLDLVNEYPDKVAFASITGAMGSYAEALSRGMFANNSTVHPSWYGADVISDFLVRVLTRSYV